jgi:hypothetical protein
MQLGAAHYLQRQLQATVRVVLREYLAHDLLLFVDSWCALVCTHLILTPGAIVRMGAAFWLQDSGELGMSRYSCSQSITSCNKHGTSFRLHSVGVLC